MRQEKFFKVFHLLDAYHTRINENKIAFIDPESAKKDIIPHLEQLKEYFPKDIDKDSDQDWANVHKSGADLWKNLASYALNSIDSNSKGNSKLFAFLEESTKFEELLYGLEDYYRDHTLHSLWVYLIGDLLLSNDLQYIYKKPNWYLYNDVNKRKEIEKYGYPDELVKYSEMKQAAVCHDVNNHTDAVWCIMALCHDLGYSLSKLDELNKRVQSVLAYFDVPIFQHVGYSLDVEHQFLVSQFLELMAIDVRIVPAEDYLQIFHEEPEKSKKEKKEFKECLKEWEKVSKSEEDNGESDLGDAWKKLSLQIPSNLKGKILLKCYRDDSTYWRLCRAMEKKDHGILSSYLIYKILGIFAESSVRGPGEEWGLEEKEAKDNIIRGDILFAIAQHEFDFAHLNQLDSLADILIIADELEEFSRLGRELMSRKYSPTAALAAIEFKADGKETNPKRGQYTDIEFTYEAKHEKLNNFLHFFHRKAERLCSIYSLNIDDDSDEQNRTDCCYVNSIKLNVIWENRESGDKEEYSICLKKESKDIDGILPIYKNYTGPRRLRCFDDELKVLIDKGNRAGDEIPLLEWLELKKPIK